MQLTTEPYLTQRERWHRSGRFILAQYDTETVVVYQAYKPSIGHFAAEHGYFGGEFRINRMSWIKTNFLWMMYRSGWGTKPDQEVTLAIWLKRSAFDTILAQAVSSTFTPNVYEDEQMWKQAVQKSEVRLQWDPDHAPGGAKQERRAIQLGLRGDALMQYSHEWIIHIEDISPFVQEQYRHIQNRDLASLRTPHESLYPVNDPLIAHRLGITE